MTMQKRHSMNESCINYQPAAESESLDANIEKRPPSNRRDSKAGKLLLCCGSRESTLKPASRNSQYQWAIFPGVGW